MKYYIATRLEQHDRHNQLRDYMAIMGPDDDFCCGHPDAGPLGTYITRASGADGHCGPSHPKFQQHPGRTPDGHIRR